MSKERKYAICRVCHAQCGLVVDFEDGKPVSTHGDKNNPAYAGFSCSKGRDLASYHNLPMRLTHSLKRLDDGSHEQYGWQKCATEISQKIKQTIQQHGPESVALYIGTFGYNTLTSQAFALAFMKAIESPMVFTSVTIDQPGKPIAAATHGIWFAGSYRHAEWDGLMLVGTNPIVSMNGGLGMNPAKNLHEAKKRGMKLIVIDPRKTDVAKQADLHLQCRPGNDAAILACIARQIIEEQLYDKKFVEEETENFEALKKAVAPFSPASVAKVSGLTEQQLVDAARLYGSFKKADVSCGTGTNMSGFGNASEYLGKVLMSLMGHWRKEGELKHNTGVFVEGFPVMAAASGSAKAWGFGQKMRVRGLEETIAGLPTGALADEILQPGKGQIKALIVLGGNPMLAWPDQLKTYEAMKALDLLVCVDPCKSKTAELADYVIAPKIHYETTGTTALNEMLGNFGGGWGYEGSYAQISPPIIDVPEGSDLCDEYAFFHAMAKSMALDLQVQTQAILGREKENYQTTFGKDDDFPDEDTVWEATLKGSPVSYREALADPDIRKGKVLDREPEVVKPKPEDWQARLNIGNESIMAELNKLQLTLAVDQEDQAFPFRLISRRLKDVHNSNWRETTTRYKRHPHHPAYINPDDLLKLGIKAGDCIDIISERSSIKCVAEEAADVLSGCISVPHCWGRNPNEEDDPLGAGGNTGRLSFNDKYFDKRTGIPLMSAIPVRLELAQ